MLSIILALSLITGNNQPQTGDLIFEIATDSEMSQAISEATAIGDSIKFTHVGIIEIDPDGRTNVIEATGKYGVVITPIDTFMLKAKAGAVIKRLNIDYPIEKTIKRAKKYLGKGYDWWYLPDNEEIYCSELVEKSYLKEDNTPIFTTIPMNFRDSEGNMPQFWQDLFSRLGKPIPEGVQGTNPTQISHNQALIHICTIRNKQSQ